MLTPRQVKVMIEAQDVRHKAMQAEVRKVIHDSRDFMAVMLAKDNGLVIDQVVRYADELAIVESFVLDVYEPTGIKVNIYSYVDDTKVACVPPSKLNID